ncbi:MAG: glycosidase, partial [Anaerolineae bacterium]|nr:glycosidase [Anaerolineae bacterium]
MLTRHAANPLISPKDVKPSRLDWNVIGTFNAGACTYKDEILLLLRVAERPISSDENIILCPYFVDGELVIDRVRKGDPDYFTDDPRLVQHRKTGLLRLTSISHLRLARSTDGVHFTVDEQPWLSATDPFEA